MHGKTDIRTAGGIVEKGELANVPREEVAYARHNRTQLRAPVTSLGT